MDNHFRLLDHRLIDLKTVGFGSNVPAGLFLHFCQWICKNAGDWKINSFKISGIDMAWLMLLYL
jgi:hypothetical protein